MGQFVLQSMEADTWVLLVVDLFFAVPESHEVSEMKSYIPQTCLIVLVKDLLHLLHVIVGQILLDQSHSSQPV